MPRLSNARKTHITRWVVPAATRLLIESASKDAPTQPLKNVAYIEMGQSPSGDSYNEQGEGVPFIGGPADLGLLFPETSRWTSVPTKLCKPGDIIVCVRATIGEPRWADNTYCLGRGVAGIRPADKSLDASFLFRIIESNEQFLREQGTGTTFKTIGKQHLAAVLVPIIPLEQQKAIGAFLQWLQESPDGRPDFSSAPPLPRSLDEQRRIISRIEELAGKLEKARTMRKETVQAADTLIGAEIQRLFSIGPKLGWNVGRLGDYVADDCYGTSEKTNDDSSGTPILRMGNIQNGRLDLKNLKYLRVRDREREKFILKRGDILVNRTNSAELVGKCAVFDAEEEYGFASYIIRLRLDTTRALPRLVAAYINSPIGRAYMFSERKQMTGQANVNSKKLKALPIALPPLPEQHRILAHLDNLQAKVDSLKKLQSETAAELDALMPSILSKAFRGEL